jgi:RimJ/RimL family protein N-acetyltransferase
MSPSIESCDVAGLAARVEHIARLHASHAALLRDFVRDVTPADRHARFLFMRALDTDAELTGAFGSTAQRSETIWTQATDGRVTAVANLVPQHGGYAEFALLVRSDLPRRGLGSVLVQLCLSRAHRLDCRLLWGMVATDNHRMRALAGKFAFRCTASRGETLEIWRDTMTRADPRRRVVPAPQPLS